MAAAVAVAPVEAARQGLTLVHFSAHHQRLLWDMLGGLMEF
jgi:hypothetical protein